MHNIAIVEARHQAHIAIAVVHHHERSIGDVHRDIVLAFGSLIIGIRVLQSHAV